MPTKPDYGILASGDYNEQIVDRMNQMAFQAAQDQLIPCENCGRTFLPDRLSIHQKSCTADNPARRRVPADSSNNNNNNKPEPESVINRGTGSNTKRPPQNRPNTRGGQPSPNTNRQTTGVSSRGRRRSSVALKNVQTSVAGAGVISQSSSSKPTHRYDKEKEGPKPPPKRLSRKETYHVSRTVQLGRNSIDLWQTEPNYSYGDSDSTSSEPKGLERSGTITLDKGLKNKPEGNRKKTTRTSSTVKTKALPNRSQDNSYDSSYADSTDRNSNRSKYDTYDKNDSKYDTYDKNDSKYGTYGANDSKYGTNDSKYDTYDTNDSKYDTYSFDDNREESDLKPCSNCGRSFRVDRLSKHMTVCKKTTAKHRKVFDSTKNRLQGTEAMAHYKKNAHKEEPKVPKSNWRQTHQDFIRSIRAAKQVQTHVAQGGKVSDLPPPPPSLNPDYVHCQYCDRRFNPEVAERHIPKCKDTINRPRPPKQKALDVYNKPVTNKQHFNSRAPAKQAGRGQNMALGNLPQTEVLETRGRRASFGTVQKRGKQNKMQSGTNYGRPNMSPGQFSNQSNANSMQSSGYYSPKYDNRFGSYDNNNNSNNDPFTRSKSRSKSRQGNQGFEMSNGNFSNHMSSNGRGPSTHQRGNRGRGKGNVDFTYNY